MILIAAALLWHIQRKKLFLVCTPGKACGLCRGCFFTGEAAAKNGIFHKNKIKRRTQ